MKSNIIAHVDAALGVFDKEAEVDAIAAITKLIERSTAEVMKSALEKIESTNNIVYRQTILADHLFGEELAPIIKVIDEHKGTIETTHAVFMCSGFIFEFPPKGLGVPSLWEENVPKPWEAKRGKK